MTSTNFNEFNTISKYIEQQCGIIVSDQKKYLVETRLTSLMAETGCTSFIQLVNMAQSDSSLGLRDKIIDVMTTNETFWFRDTYPFTILREAIFPAYEKDIKAGRRTKIRIWCAASSTGQEPYSIAITFREYCRLSTVLKPQHLEVVATDISPTVIFIALAARYDKFAINRGLSNELKSKYFVNQGPIWTLDSEIKKMVQFKRLNLQDSFLLLGRFDIVFCRNVLIYFALEFKQDILRRIKEILFPKGYLFVGASETIFNYSDDFDHIQYHKGNYFKART